MAFSVQFGLIACVALILARLGRRASPKSRLALLQLGLLAALCAPFLQMKAGRVLAQPMVGIEARAPEAATPPPSSGGLSMSTLAIGVLAAGAMLRLAWTLIGLAALAQRRRRARIASGDCPEFLELRTRLVVDAELRVGSSGPVAFGLIRPTVLIPQSLLDSNREALAAVLAHELVHLRRRDWLFVLGEEVLLALLWFHPAAWLLIREIRLTREESVDEQAAESATGPYVYLEALLAVARLRLAPARVPGAEFLRDRQIARRIETLIQQEKPMSRRFQRSLTLSSTVLLAAAAWWGASLSPLVGAPQSLSPSIESNEAISVAQGLEGLILPTGGRPPLYSPGALLSGIAGGVTLELTLDASGNVVDSRALSGPLELRQEAVRWSLDWRYDTSIQPARRVIATVSFRLPETAPQMAFSLLGFNRTLESIDFPAGATVLRSVQAAGIDPPNPALQARLETYLGRDFAKEPDLALTLHSEIVSLVGEGDSYTAVHAAVMPGADGAVLVLRQTRRDIHLANPQPPSATGAPPAPPKRIKVGGAVQTSRLIRQVRPQYPALARQADIQGTVQLNVVIDHEGAVQSIDVGSGHPLLIPAAVDAVKQWRYKPTLLNGNPVEVEAPVNVNFTLAP
ncbi:MAG: TonB family protein [Acidobacteria bacterium]|nr:TonB family protein [Acidobacteriota bacterium]